MNSINWTIKALKQLRKLDKPVQKPITDAVDKLENMPECANVKALTNHEHGFRLRVGNYRVMFDWDTKIKIIEIQEVSKRDERTY